MHKNQSFAYELDSTRFPHTDIDGDPSIDVIYHHKHSHALSAPAEIRAPSSCDHLEWIHHPVVVLLSPKAAFRRGIQPFNTRGSISPNVLILGGYLTNTYSG